MPPAHDEERGTRGQRSARRSASSPPTAGMPAAASIVAETLFSPSAVEAPAEGRTYRILRTTEVDPYDQPIAPSAVPGLEAAVTAPPSDRFQGTARKAAK